VINNLVVIFTILVRVDRAGHHPHDQDREDDHQVVDHRRPSGRAEDLLGVEHRREQREHAVEEDLGQQQVGERRGQAGAGLT
jgi:hypothetical protein